MATCRAGKVTRKITVALSTPFFGGLVGVKGDGKGKEETQFFYGAGFSARKELG